MAATWRPGRLKCFLPSRARLVKMWKEGDAVFGNPFWFRPKTAGWGITPVRWQGWFYAMLWAAAIAAPFLFLLWGRGAIEALLWLGASMGMLVWDVRQILRRLRGATDDDVLVIDDSRPHSTDLATRNFQMRLKGAPR